MAKINSGPILGLITSALSRAQIAYMIVGSFASNLYGAGRATLDIDIVVSASADQIRTFLDGLDKNELYFDLQAAIEACGRKSMFNILDMSTGWKIDIIFEKPGLYHQLALKRRTPADIEQVPLYAATAEDVIISKLDWARMGSSSRQIDDVAGILKERYESLDLGYIEKWIKELGLATQWNDARKAAGLA